MNTKKVALNWGLVFDGLYFTSFNACGRYKGTETAKRPQWQKDHPNDFTPLADILKDETDIRTDVIAQEVGSSTSASHRLATDKADDNAQFAQPRLQGSLLSDQSAVARGRPATPDQHFRLPPPTQTITVGAGQIAPSETKGSGPDTSRPKVIRPSGPSGDRQPKKQTPSAGSPKSAPKLSLERMIIVLESLRECRVYARAAEKAGIHRKTLEYWLKCSKAGDDGYDLVWEGVLWSFHEHCTTAIQEAEEKVLAVAWEMAKGIKYPGYDAYVKRPNVKMLRCLLKLMLPEKYGKRWKAEATHCSPVLIVGQPAKRREYNTAASIQARRWKSLSNKIGNAPA